MSGSGSRSPHDLASLLHYVCWTPNATSIYRVYRDTALFNELWYYYSDIYMAIRSEWDSPPPLPPDHKRKIAELVRLSNKSWERF